MYRPVLSLKEGRISNHRVRICLYLFIKLIDSKHVLNQVCDVRNSIIRVIGNADKTKTIVAVIDNVDEHATGLIRTSSTAEKKGQGRSVYLRGKDGTAIRREDIKNPVAFYNMAAYRSQHWRVPCSLYRQVFVFTIENIIIVL